MKEKIGYILAGITIFSFLAGGIMAWSKIEAKTDKIPEIEKKIDEEVADINEDIEKVDEELTDNEKIDLEQSILIKQIGETLNKLNDKIDKERMP